MIAQLALNLKFMDRSACSSPRLPGNRVGLDWARRRERGEEVCVLSCVCVCVLSTIRHMFATSHVASAHARHTSLVGIVSTWCAKTGCCGFGSSRKALRIRSVPCMVAKLLWEMVRAAQAGYKLGEAG